MTQTVSEFLHILRFLQTYYFEHFLQILKKVAPRVKNVPVAVSLAYFGIGEYRVNTASPIEWLRGRGQFERRRLRGAAYRLEAPREPRGLAVLLLRRIHGSYIAIAMFTHHLTRFRMALMMNYNYVQSWLWETSESFF